MRKQLLFW